MPKWCLLGKLEWFQHVVFSRNILCPNGTSNFMIQTYDHVVFWLELSYVFFCVCVWGVGGHIEIHLNILYIYAIQNHSISINTLIFNNKKAPCVPWKSSPRVNLFGHWKFPLKTPDPWGKWFESAHLRSPPAAKVVNITYRNNGRYTETTHPPKKPYTPAKFLPWQFNGQSTIFNRRYASSFKVHFPACHVSF